MTTTGSPLSLTDLMRIYNDARALRRQGLRTQADVNAARRVVEARIRNLRDARSAEAEAVYYTVTDANGREVAAVHLVEEGFGRGDLVRRVDSGHEWVTLYPLGNTVVEALANAGLL